MIHGQPIENSSMQVFISKKSFETLLESAFNSAGPANVQTLGEPLSMLVEDLEDLAEGYSNVFKETDKVEVTTSVKKVHQINFDKEFQNIAFKAELTVYFSNPINPAFQSAKALVVVSGFATVGLRDTFDLGF